jgi:small subunit ribosomal protein S8
MMTDPIADMLTRIRNAAAVNHSQVIVPHSKVKEAIANTLKKEGYIEDFTVRPTPTNQGEIEIKLRYKGQLSTITKIERVSKPGRRIYVKSKNIEPILSGYGISIISTSKGIMSGKEAAHHKLGGELICHIW